VNTERIESLIDAGNLNAAAIRGTHYLSFYSGKAPDIMVLVSVLPAPTAGDSHSSPLRPDRRQSNTLPPDP